MHGDGVSSSSAIRDLAPQRAIVVPRATRRGSRANLPLDQLLLPIIRSARQGTVLICAPPGGGKTTALRHLRAVLPADVPVTFFDEVAAGCSKSSGICLLTSCNSQVIADCVDAVTLSPWTLDDCLEYLSVSHRDQCGSIFSRVREDDSVRLFEGSPQLLAGLLDAMAEDETMCDSRTWLSNQLRAVIPPGPAREKLITGEIKESALHPDQQRLWRHHAVRQVCHAGWIAEQLCQGTLPTQLREMQSPELIRAIAAAVQGQPSAIQFMEQTIREHRRSASVPMLASILLASDPQWRPAEARELNLSGAQLAGAQWAWIDLSGAMLMNADLAGADLSLAILATANADGADLTHTNLRGAQIDRMRMVGANLQKADLRDAMADRTDFSQANCEFADLTKASTVDARFTGANLSSAICRSADFTGCDFTSASFDAATFDGATLERTRMVHADLSEASWNEVSFKSASLLQCNLEYLAISSADFEQANLLGSLLTGTQMHRANFRDANLARTGLADVDWENADLANACMKHASFHLGSTRCGLVGSTIAGEGSRTGFYTDDFNDHTFKDAEEIRKACLRGANLLGADVEQTDFYLVDLRRAKYSIQQAGHFRKCAAIL